jgi:hypothetical protein
MRSVPAALAALCRRHLGEEPESISPFLGRDGHARASMRLSVGAGSYIATRRAAPRRTQLEAVTLRVLTAGGAPVPRCIAFEEGWLLQEDLGTRTLAQALATATAPTDLLKQAITALGQVHRVGQASPLRARLPAGGQGPEWARRRLDRLVQLGIPTPPDFKATFLHLLSTPGTAFIKRDARPANAALAPDGTVRWFDWEHVCRRWPVDDLVWLLCDETVPDPAAARALLLDWVAQTPGCAPEPAAHYLAVATVHHYAWRIGLHLEALGTHGETSWERCVSQDWTGSSEALRRLGRAGAQAAEAWPLTAPLSPWFTQVAK